MPSARASDLILLARSIHTMGPRGPVEAVHVVDGHIAATGSTEDVMVGRGRHTEVVDLGDAVVLPGLVEPHTHPELCAQMYAWHDVSGFRHPEVAQVEDVLRRAVASTPKGQWIFAFGLDPMLTADLGAWHRDRLDSFTTDHPVFVMIQSMHTAYVNSPALQLAGLDDTTPDPPGGGHYSRDADGRLTGRLEEAPAMLAFLRFVDTAEEALRSRLVDQYQRYRDVGITSLGIAGTFAGVKDLPVFLGVATEATTPVRSTAYLRHHMVSQLSAFPREGERLRMQGIKLWYDGSPYTGTMLLEEPYLDTDLCCCTLGIPAGTVGRANFTFDEMRQTLTELYEGGWQVLTHAQGDRGCAEILDLYAEIIGPRQPAGPGSADDATPVHREHRWRLEHCALISRPDLARAKQLGVSPSFHVNHVLHYGPELRDQIIGKERAQRLMPLGTAVEMGHRISLHADSPMYPPSPLSLVRTAVTRRTRHGDVLGQHHAIDLHTALRAVTIDAAWQLRFEDETGSIEPGKRADFTVLDRDPYEVDPDDLHRLGVLDTWLDGVPTSQT